jgi:Ca-activated chloride channel family protein
MRTSFSVLGVLLALLATARADDAILVLDASGSMWGQIEGTTKVEIARSVMGGLLAELPADRRLGLVAYGHRREADCSDIEEIVPVGTDRAAIKSAVDALTFKGRTPLTAAVKFAAEKLGYQSQKATVILVSDGLETCNLDPCALGRELEAAGVDFTAHVIGFGLASDAESAGLQCLAEATGGKYIGAGNATALAAALTETVAAPAEPPVAPEVARVVLRATELDGGPEIMTGLAWTIRGAGGAVLERTDAGIVETEVPPGDYEVTVQRAEDGQTGTARLEARAGSERTVTIPLEISLAASLSITPAAEAPAGSAISVQWTGPDRRGDYVTVVQADAGVNEFLSYRDTIDGNPAELVLPPEPGAYEVRYVLNQPRRVLASVPFEVTDVAATLTVPASGVAGSDVQIDWVGPNYAGDWVTVVTPDAAVSTYNDYIDANRPDRLLEMPVEPGAYEVRYVQGGSKVLARAPITVTAATAEITAPASVVAGASFEISWTAANNRGDWLTIVAPDAAVSAYGAYVDADRGSPANLTAPATAGAYELRYVLKGKKVIATRSIEITAP